MTIVYILIGLICGGFAGWAMTILNQKNKSVSKSDYDEAIARLNTLNTELGIEKEKNKNLSEGNSTKDNTLNKQAEENKSLNTLLATAHARIESADKAREKYTEEFNAIKAELKNRTDEFHEVNKKLAEMLAINKSLNEKLEVQKTEMENLRKQFNTEFENIASKILEEKSEKFTKLNQDNLAGILKPLGENIDIFKKKVEEVYDKEAKERFSLGKEVSRLVELNQKISDQANNLTNALKGNSKTQGDWGQMILENILEKSGLVKDREYFVQEYLKDADGNYLKNEDGTKMQPDVIVAYPDNRKVIVDSKVSLTAYTRYAETDDPAEQKKALDEHLKSVRKHIDELSRKNYQDFAPSLDFVMMFVPNEPACLLAMQNDADLWHYAYHKRILLISPTNLIASLKLIVDLWKREYQNRNAQDIAERGAALYDKFVGFVDSLTDIGGHIERTQKSYEAALGQLKEGRGNLIGQAEKLKELGVKAKKKLPPSLLAGSSAEKEE